MNEQNEKFYQRLIDALDFMEGICGPDHEDYILIMEKFKLEVEGRIAMARQILDVEREIKRSK